MKKWVLVFICLFLKWMTLGSIEAQPATQDNLKDWLKIVNFRSIGPTRPSGRFVDFAVSSQDP